MGRFAEVRIVPASLDTEEKLNTCYGRSDDPAIIIGSSDSAQYRANVQAAIMEGGTDV